MQNDLLQASSLELRVKELEDQKTQVDKQKMEVDKQKLQLTQLIAAHKAKQAQFDSQWAEV